MVRKGFEKKDLSDRTYDLADFQAQLSGGSMRWLASLLAIGSFGLLLFFATSSKEPEIDFPFHFKGKSVLWISGIAFVVWLAISIVTWKKWLKKK